MKRLFFILCAVLCVAGFAVAKETPVSRRAEMVQKYAPKPQPAQLTQELVFEAAQNGDGLTLSRITDKALLTATDKFGNNVFHLAKNAATVQTLAAVIRRIDSEQYKETIEFLRNQRNQSGETPLMAHINYGKTDTFRLLYEGSELAAAIRAANAVDKGGALRAAADVKKGVAVSLAKDNSGRTVAQAAVANADVPGMKRIVEYFTYNAPYLL